MATHSHLAVLSNALLLLVSSSQQPLEEFVKMPPHDATDGMFLF
jgi:hypothetical protein